MALCYGDKAEIVLDVQKRLRELGYKIPQLNGIMDNATVVAVIHYQRASGIFINNGQVDQQTLEALKLLPD